MFQSGTHFIIRLVSVLTSFKSVTGYLQLHLGKGLRWMKTDSGSLKRLSSWIHLFWKTKYGPERFLLNCCSVYTDWFFVAPWTAACQAPQDPSVSPRVCLNSHPLSQWCHLSILPSAAPFSFNLSQNQSFSMSQLFAPGGQRIGAAASASVLPMNIWGWFPFDLIWLVWSPCSPRDSQESSPTPQFKSISSSVLSFLYDPTLTSIHDYWKNHSFD